MDQERSGKGIVRKGNKNDCLYCDTYSWLVDTIDDLSRRELSADLTDFPARLNTCPYQSSAVSHLASCTNMGIFNFNDAFDARKKYTRFRILVIGRANAGKTTLLKRVCNTTEEPCIYDENNNNLVRFSLSVAPTPPLITLDNRSIQTQR